MDTYFYKIRDKERGPVSFKTLAFLFDKGLVDGNVLVQKNGEGEWLPASQLPEFQDKIKTGVVNYAEISDEALDIVEKSDVTVSPWLRFFARKYDYFIFSVFFSFFLFFFPPYVVRNQVLLSLLIIFIWVFVEAGFLSFFGTTPGKWIFNLKIRNFKGEKLSFSDSLTRSFLVWLKGIALGLPIISIIAMYISGNKLKKEGITDWDYKVGSLILQEKKLSVFKIIVSVLIGILIVLATQL